MRSVEKNIADSFINNKKINSYHKKIEILVFNSAKRFVRNEVKKYLEYKGQANQLWKKSDKLSFVKKYKKLRFFQEEVDVMLCTSVDEIRTLYLSLGIEDEKYWFQKLGKWYSDAYEKVKSPKCLQEDVYENSLLNFYETETVLVKHRKLRDFSNIKV